LHKTIQAHEAYIKLVQADKSLSQNFLQLATKYTSTSALPQIQCYIVTLLHNLLELAILDLTNLELTNLELAILELTILELYILELVILELPIPEWAILKLPIPELAIPEF
jgi:hypothetical protein